jgi:hypothetical protein
VKIKNSTQWSNIYSNASKYNISVKDSRYRLALYGLLIVIASLAILICFTFQYILAQSLAIISVIYFSLLLSIKNNKAIIDSFVLSTVGEIILNKDLGSYQLLASSRHSFIGCWLIMIPIQTTHLQHYLGRKTRPKHLFLFRDSLTKQDYSRIARVLSELE